MRRFRFIVVASAVLAGLVPASALARHHHRSHHARVHHVRVRHQRFGDINGQSSPQTPTSPTPAPTAGTVMSFTGGILTIKLNDGTLVSGAVTANTELECVAAQPASTVHEDGDGGGDNSGGGDNQGGQSGGGGGDNQGGQSGGDESQGGDDQGEQQQTCTVASLTPGAVVSGAELGISGSGAAWDKVELIA